MSVTNETVYVVDDDASVRNALLRLVRSVGYTAVGFDTAEDFLHHGCCEGPACVLLDVIMSDGLSGLDFQDRLRHLCPGLPVIFLTGSASVDITVRAMKNGAIDFLTKPVDDQKLIDAIRLAMRKHRKLLFERDSVHEIKELLKLLTPREHEVMLHVIAGSLNKQIALALYISQKTVKVHRCRVMEKLGAESVADLVRMCSRVGLKPASTYLEKDVVGACEPDDFE